jgi:hypothetical protein
MSENLYQVKAFVVRDGKYQEIVENYSTYNEGEKRYNELVKVDLTCDAAYLYIDGTLSLSWSSSYDDYLDRLQEEAERNGCVYCGSTSLDGYCWRSPDGNHLGGGEYA